MKKLLFYTLFFAAAATTMLAGCKKDGNYPGGTVSPYIPLYDLRNLYKGTDLTLSADNMFGSTKISGVVVSDFSGKNMPEGLLVLQDKKRLQQLRGISIPIGADAAKYIPGDSVSVDVVGGVLKRVNGLLQITGVPASSVTKVATGRVIPPNRVPSSAILADPSRYESTLVAIVKGGFDPLPTPADKFGGDKIVNDGFENITLHTEAGATFANTSLPVSANFYGIVFEQAGAKPGEFIPEVRMRTGNDVQILSSTVEIKPVLISGFISDVEGGDGNYEYMQFLATKDIDFKATPYSVVVTNNAGASLPGGFPTLSWATGSLTTTGAARTYKLDITSGSAKKGTYFYVGGTTKLINGPNSTDISSSNWVKAFNYSTTNGNGFGVKTSGLFANSGNASGFAIFQGTTVNANTVPVDVIMVGAGGSLLSPDGTQGYRIANTDWYDIINPITLEPQPFYRQGSNTLNMVYTTSDQGFFYKLSGIYNVRLGKWVQARTQNNLDLTKTSTIDELEGLTIRIGVDQNGTEVSRDTIPPTTLKF
ncbi:MAG: hypothetical protein K0S09_470 [Sphingobacteriaceae bacterium]|nr:hypothetical protein [Sphingobacteriaceae bacterium]